MSDYSANEDDPDVYESSGDEWEEAVEKKRNKRRTSHRLSKKAKVAYSDSSDSNEEDIQKLVNCINRKGKKAYNKVVPISVNQPTASPQEKATSPTNQYNFSSGTFVISKKDAQQANTSNPPCIWKIDGKALLQKFEPFEEDGKVRYRNTSVYTGRSCLDKDNYASIHVQMYLHSGQKMILEIDWDQLKTITIDSD